MPNSQIIDEAIFPDSHHKDLKRIVAISIDEGSAEYVFDWAVNNFINPASDLVVFLNCRQVDAPIAPYINPTNFIEEFDDKKKIKSHHLLKTYADKLKPFNIAIRAIALLGDPKVEIIRKVTELKADVLLLGSRQLGSIKRALLGSVSDYCGHNCPCTVIIVKAHPEHPQGKHEYKNIFQRKSV
ncbi:universal stress protein A-like protein-like [Mucor ambiguus]|uniref:Universal stress protein A-like protein-like n=1 Tax=Mucor ambiguus TaxID=91626 RepID=A0A0C9MHS1_9FUNG|nr:universal stress protein A-like protein-like [Mucor ambiguus]